MIPKKVVIKFRDYFTALYKNVLLGINTTPFYFEFYTLVLLSAKNNDALVKIINNLI